MAEEDVKKEENADYIAAIEELKNNTVEREKYEKLKAENKQLLDALVKGEKIEGAKEKKEFDMNKAVDDLMYGDNTNLAYIEKALEIRAHIIGEGGDDPFICKDPLSALPTEEQKTRASEVAQVLQECVDYADGDAGVFQAELQRRCKDPLVANRPK